MKLPPTLLIRETNFANAWARAVRNVLRDGREITIGDASEPKPIRDACATIELTGDAIRQVEDRELHPQFPFRHVGKYCEEFTRRYLSQYLAKPEHARFSYLYFDRLSSERGEYMDQLEGLSDSLAEQVDTNFPSNRNQAITWMPCRDIESNSPPCLQRVWTRYLGGQSVEVHLTWRSRDLYTAWQANIIALVDMLNREVVAPNDCRIVKLADYSDSLHIYESDVAAAADVKLVPVFPRD